MNVFTNRCKKCDAQHLSIKSYKKRLCHLVRCVWLFLPANVQASWHFFWAKVPRVSKSSQKCSKASKSALSVVGFTNWHVSGSRSKSVGKPDYLSVVFLLYLPKCLECPKVLKSAKKCPKVPWVWLITSGYPPLPAKVQASWHLSSSGLQKWDSSQSWRNCQQNQDKRGNNTVKSKTCHIISNKRGLVEVKSNCWKITNLMD